MHFEFRICFGCNTNVRSLHYWPHFQVHSAHIPYGLLFNIIYRPSSVQSLWQRELPFSFQKGFCINAVHFSNFDAYIQRGFRRGASECLSFALVWWVKLILTVEWISTRRIVLRCLGQISMDTFGMLSRADEFRLGVLIRPVYKIEGIKCPSCFDEGVRRRF